MKTKKQIEKEIERLEQVLAEPFLDVRSEEEHKSAIHFLRGNLRGLRWTLDRISGAFQPVKGPKS